MITVSDLSLNFGGQSLFKHVNLKFTPGNCYGVIGANGAGKSTFLRILSGELEPSSGEVVIDAKTRMSVLKQNHFAYDDYTVLDTVISGNPRLYEVMKQKDALYAKVLGTMLAPITSLAVVLGQIVEKSGGSVESADTAEAEAPAAE